MRGEPRALGAERLLDDLDQDLLAFLQQVLDLGLRLIAVAVAVASAAIAARGWPASPGSPVRCGVERLRGSLRRRLGRSAPGSPAGDDGDGAVVSVGSVVIVAGEALELLDGVDDLSDVEEGVALEADVDEGRLHAGQDLRDPPLVDVADDAALILALDEDLDDLVVLENGDARIVRARRR